MKKEYAQTDNNIEHPHDFLLPQLNQVCIYSSQKAKNCFHMFNHE